VSEEIASVHIKSTIDQLLNAYALSNMHRASGNTEYAKGALAWFTHIESSLRAARSELEKSLKGPQP